MHAEQVLSDNKTIYDLSACDKNIHSTKQTKELLNNPLHHCAF